MTYARPALLRASSRSARRHEHGVLVAGSLALGVYLVAKGATSLLT